MKKGALLIAGAVLAFQAAQAQFADNDLYLGFNESGAASDYIINLGAASNIVGGTNVVTLSSDVNLSTLNSIFSSPIGVGAGVVGGGEIRGLNPVWDIYLTAVRNGPGDNTVPNSTLASPVDNSYNAQTYSEISQNLSWPNTAGGSSGNTTTPDTSWTATVGPAQVNGNFYSDTGNNPISDIGSSGVLYEDLYYNVDTNGTAYQYLGYFTLDVSDANPKLTFTPKNAPQTLTPPVIMSVNKTGSTVTLVSSNAVSTHTYQLQYTASLSPTNWINVGSSQVAGATMVTNTDASATDSHRFYRVMAQ